MTTNIINFRNTTPSQSGFNGVIGIDVSAMGLGVDVRHVRPFFVKDNAMAPKFSFNDVVLVDSSCTFYEGPAFYLVRINGVELFKRIMHTSKGYEVGSLNEAQYPDKELITYEELQKVEIIGKFLACLTLKM